MQFARDQAAGEKLLAVKRATNPQAQKILSMMIASMPHYFHTTSGCFCTVNENSQKTVNGRCIYSCYGSPLRTAKCSKRSKCSRPKLHCFNLRCFHRAEPPLSRRRCRGRFVQDWRAMRQFEKNRQARQPEKTEGNKKKSHIRLRAATTALCLEQPKERVPRYVTPRLQSSHSA